ncbi:MAG: serine hydrolase [Flavobacteriales bacterium]|nr:MAG: serine hydrolase [Flavobacteriales bacterium]
MKFKLVLILFRLGLFFLVNLLFSQENLTYSNPSEVGLDSTFIYKSVDSIMTVGIKNHAFPGAQVLVAKDNKVIFHQTYGYHTYDSVLPVAKNDIYDLASVTKIIGPLPALMKLVDEGKLDLDKALSEYWPKWKRKKDKKELMLREILAHQAGLKPYIVFLNKVIKKNGKIKHRFIRTKPSKRFTYKVNDSLYVKNRFNRKMYRMINRSKVADEKKYKYSGLTFLIFPKLIENLTGLPYSEYLQKNFYQPIGAATLGFNPKTKKINRIVPTEVDTLFRQGLVTGWVHDENASLLGGVSGNAGLFGSATDLAKMMLMYQNYGAFNSKRILSENVVKEFTRIQYPENENRRGLGFDKPLMGNDTLPLKDAYPAPEVSAASFGHSGFTGTFVWADPKNKITFIFLSNRVYPTRKNRNLYEYYIREALQQVFYKARVEQNNL